MSISTVIILLLMFILFYSFFLLKKKNELLVIAQRELDTVEKKFYNVVANSSDVIFILDDKGKVHYQNQLAQKTFTESYIDKILWEQLNIEPLKYLSTSEKMVDVVLTINNQEKHFNLFKRPTWYDNKDLWMYNFRDITERNLVEQELRKSKTELEERIERRTQALSQEVKQRKIIEDRLVARAKDLYRSNADLESFAYIASHDLKEPLRTVTSYVQLLERKYREQLDDQAKELIDFAVDGTKRMQSLINDLLEYSRIGTHAGKFEPVNLNDTLFLIVNSLTTQIEENNVALEISPLPTIKADKSQMKQVFQNFIGNAIKFKHPEREPQIKILYKDLGDYWRFGIKDNGIGINEEYKEKVFQLFQRLNRRDQYKGTGVGLAICKRIIERHGGEVWLESKEGEGTTFYFTIRKSIISFDDKTA